MSRSYLVLAVALAGVVGLAAVAQLLLPSDPGNDVVAAAPAERPAAIADESAPADMTVEPTELATDVRGELGLEPIAVIDPECTLSVPLEFGDEHDEVACLESQLIAAGVLVDSSPDRTFDRATDASVRAFQGQNGLVVDGMVGPQTANQLGSWAGPDILPPDPDTCPESGRAAVIDRFNQRSWLCDDGEISRVVPITTAVSQPDPGTYQVYEKDLYASSDISGDYSTMTHFVAFTHGENQGARIAFHSIPKYPGGDYVQPPDSIGSAELHGESAGCIRVLPRDAALIWSWLDVGDDVKVVT